MDNRFSPYQGAKPFLFISYGRGDIEVVLPVIAELRNQNYRIWYDEGIPVGTDWPMYISRRVNASSAILFFLSGKSMVSPNCYSEMVSAAQSGKRIICVLIDSSAQLLYGALLRDGKLSEEEIMQIKEETASFAARRKSKSKLPECTDWLAPLEKASFVSGNTETYVPQILACNVLSSEFIGPYRDRTTQTVRWQRPLAVAAACLLLLGSIGALLSRQMRLAPEPEAAAVFSQEDVPKPTIDPGSIPVGLVNKIIFPDSQQERAVRQAIGIEAGDLQEQDLQSITQLHFCGKTVLKAPQPIQYEDGSWTVNGAPVSPGVIRDLSVMEKMYYLESLTLVQQNITSIKSLSQLEVLQHLDISGNPISSIPMNDGFRNLVTLNISHTQIRSLVDISAPQTLKTVYVSADMLPMELDRDASYQVVLVK